PDLYQYQIMVEDPRVINFEKYVIDVLTQANIDQLSDSAAEGVDDLSELEDLFTKRPQKIPKTTTVTYVRLLFDFLNQGSALDRLQIVDFFNSIRYKLLLDTECQEIAQQYSKNLASTLQNYVNLGYDVGALAGQDYQTQYTALVNTVKSETLTKPEYPCSCCCKYCDDSKLQKNQLLWKLLCAFTGLYTWVHYAALVPLRFMPNGIPYIVPTKRYPPTGQ
ncbi:hypothetical protein Ciccas_008228, partial [Cichlidogyrus casuarinus]